MEFYNRNWRVPSSWNGTEDNNNKVSNYSMSFDGSSESIQTSNIASLNNVSKFSISYWFKISDFLSIKRFLGTYSGNTSNWIMNLFNSSVGLTFLVRNNDRSKADLEVVSSGKIAVDTWQHISMVYDGLQSGNDNRLKVYLNGTLETLTFTGTIPASTPSNLTGGFNIGSDGFSNQGAKELDQVAIFDYALSASQVTELYGSSSNGVGNPMAITNGRKPVAYYPLGDHSAYNGTEYLVANSALSDYVFDFVPNDYIDCGTGLGDTLGTVTNLSISTWVKAPSTAINDFTFNIGSFSNSYGAINFNIHSNKLTVRLNNDAGRFSLNPFTSTDWNNVVFVYDGSSQSNSKLYINGQLQTTVFSGSFPSTLNLAGLKTILGAGYSASFSFNGLISNTAIFNTALPATGTESVESLYNYGTPPDISSYSGLQGFWKLDAGSTFDGSTWSIPDESSNSNNGTSSGMTAANLVQSNLNILSPYSRYALEFDGSSEYINFNSSTELNNVPSNPFSFSFWFKSSTAGRVLSEKRVANNFLNAQYTIHLESGYIKWYGGSDGVVAGTQTSFTLIDDKWHHIVCVAESTTVNKIYVDGQLNVTSSANRLNSSVVAGSLRIGANFSNAYGFIGSISNYSIWNAALNSTQVTEIYNEGKPSNLNNHSAYSNLVSWWQLGENSSFNSNWTVLNEISTGPNGVSVNMAEDDLVDGVGTTANGLSSGMGGADNINGDAPYSTSNALSYGMGADAKSSSVPT